MAYIQDHTNKRVGSLLAIIKQHILINLLVNQQIGEHEAKRYLSGKEIWVKI
jgi:hypothetical protein